MSAVKGCGISIFTQLYHQGEQVRPLLLGMVRPLLLGNRQHRIRMKKYTVCL